MTAARVEARCNSVQVGGAGFAQSGELLFSGRCATSRSWVVRTSMPQGIVSTINVASLSYTVREVGPGGGVNEYTRAMTRTGDVFILRGCDVSIIPTGTAANAFRVGCTVDVSESPSAPCWQYISQGQVAIAANGNGLIVIPPFARKLQLTVSTQITSMRVNFNADGGGGQSANLINTPVQPPGIPVITIPGHAIVAQIFNDDANVGATFHGTWEIFS